MEPIHQPTTDLGSDLTLHSGLAQPKKELLFGDLPHDERTRLIDDVNTEMNILTQSAGTRVPFILARFSLTIVVPLILSLLILLLSQHSAPIPVFGGPAATEPDSVIRPDRLHPPPFEPSDRELEDRQYREPRVLHPSELDYFDAQRILNARHRFQLVLLLIAFALVTIVFLVGQQFVSAAQTHLTTLWCEIKKRNGLVAQNGD
jgi:hypothetical protein